MTKPESSAVSILISCCLALAPSSAVAKPKRILPVPTASPSPLPSWSPMPNLLMQGTVASPSPLVTVEPPVVVPPAATPEREKTLGAQLGKVRSQPASVARSIEEAKLAYYYGLATTDRERRKKIFAEGVEAAQRARDADPASAAALAWWTANEANLADAVSNLSSLKMLSKVEDALEKLQAMAPDFEGAAADRGLGRLYHKAPSFLSVGSSSKADAAFRRAMAKFPEYPGNRVYYAQFLYERGACRESRKLAQLVQESKPEAKYPLDAPGWLEIAAEIMRDTLAGCGKR